MDGVRPGDLGGGDDSVALEITLSGLGSADTNGSIGQPKPVRTAIVFRENADGFDPHFMGGADHAQGDLAAVRHENPLELFLLGGGGHESY